MICMRLKLGKENHALPSISFGWTVANQAHDQSLGAYCNVARLRGLELLLRCIRTNLFVAQVCHYRSIDARCKIELTTESTTCIVDASDAQREVAHSRMTVPVVSS
jgi:hypothetical protein